MTKQNLRERALADRDAMGLDAGRAAAHALSSLSQSMLSVSGSCVSFYHAIGSEIDPAALVQSLCAKAVQPALPILLDRQTMVFRLWDRTKALVPAGFGTLGPDASQAEVLPDLVFAPLAAFSALGQRIGYGKGHYDRALSKMREDGHVPAFIGLAFDQQEVPPFPAEVHDVPLDAVLTPSGLRIFDHGRDALAPFLSQAMPAKAQT